MFLLNSIFSEIQGSHCILEEAFDKPFGKFRADSGGVALKESGCLQATLAEFTEAMFFLQAMLAACAELIEVSLSKPGIPWQQSSERSRPFTTTYSGI